ncbi:MAG: FAD-dependent 2-polyprenyl-6-methoxyphenol hydroxylase protein [Marmoricola sp.]|nr:FAD-dependent 2-polyprenyl-6-methoxyphenol hydroxylase protein [Marmoricola sp.]
MRALVIGAGIGGMSAGIALDRQDVEVELVEIDPLWRVYGAGITIAGATLRALDALGVYEAVQREGYVGNGIRVCSVGGDRLWDVPTPMPEDSGVEGCGGILRPVLHRILSRKVLSAGIPVRLGVSVDSFQQDSEGVDVIFSDGSQGRFDLVVGADGIYSRTRQQIFPDAPLPEYTGQSVWRILTDRPTDVNCRHYFLGGPAKVGFTPVSATQMYLFVAERTQREVRNADELHDDLGRLLADYGGIVAEIRDAVTPDTEIVFRPLEIFRLPAPWHVGRIVLIGDAAHPTTPQLASGAGIAVEDALVLSEEVARYDSVPEALTAFLLRREERCRFVVESSIEIGRLEQAGASPEEQTAIAAAALAKLAEPI